MTLKEQMVSTPAELKAARHKIGLTPVGASNALEISAEQLERRESDLGSPLSIREIEQRYSNFLENADKNLLSNMILQRFSVRYARLTLGLSVEQMAERFHVSESQWQKYECNSRELADSIRKEQENEVLVVWKKVIQEHQNPN